MKRGKFSRLKEELSEKAHTGSFRMGFMRQLYFGMENGGRVLYHGTKS
jgi:hypothetical protein